MRKRNREINIFSVSALDLFASAMGVFALIAIILFPYYLRTQTGDDSAALRKKIERLEVENHRLREQLKQSFLVVVLSWRTTEQDIDLHVIDPEGNEFFYRQHNRDQTHFPDTDAFLTVDSLTGPGIEVWLHPNVSTGRYQIFANLYNRRSNNQNPLVSGKIFFRDGNLDLPALVLKRQSLKVRMADVIVDNQGRISLSTPR